MTSFSSASPRRSAHVGEGRAHLVSQRIARAGRDVRRDDDVAQREQRIGDGRRLLLEHVEAGAAEPAVTSASASADLVDQAAARGVDG